MSPNAGAIESPITVLYSCAYRPHTNVEIEIYNKKMDIVFIGKNYINFRCLKKSVICPKST